MNETEDSKKPKVGHWVWALTLFGIVFILSGSFIAYKLLSIPEETSKVLSNILKPNIKYETIVLSTIGEIKKESKFVVQSTEINLTIEKSTTKTILWDKLNLGTTVVEMQISGNKVQYILPLDLIAASIFKWDEKTGEVVVSVPMPILDEDIVEVQSNPDKIKIKKDIGWARLDKNSGKYLEDEIRKSLRNKVIEEGKKKILLEEAHRNAEKAIIEIFKLKMKSENVDFPLRINFN
jgi:hypothetical protein